jgi:hypothetical protein
LWFVIESFFLIEGLLTLGEGKRCSAIFALNVLVWHFQNPLSFLAQVWSWPFSWLIWVLLFVTGKYPVTKPMFLSYHVSQAFAPFSAKYFFTRFGL